MGILEIAALLASSGYTVWKSYNVIRGVLDSKRMTKWQIISRIVNGAVTGVYEDFVRDAKNENSDGKLSSAEKAKARDLAYDRVIQGLKEHNMGMTDLKPDEILDMIENAVTSKKVLSGKA